MGGPSSLGAVGGRPLTAVVTLTFTTGSGSNSHSARRLRFASSGSEVGRGRRTTAASRAIRVFPGGDIRIRSTVPLSKRHAQGQTVRVRLARPAPGPFPDQSAMTCTGKGVDNERMAAIKTPWSLFSPAQPFWTLCRHRTSSSSTPRPPRPAADEPPYRRPPPLFQGAPSYAAALREKGPPSERERKIWEFTGGGAVRVGECRWLTGFDCVASSSISFLPCILRRPALGLGLCPSVGFSWDDPGLDGWIGFEIVPSGVSLACA